MSDPLKQFLDVQMVVAKLLEKQSETLIRECSSVLQQAVSTASDMHDSGISFLREVMAMEKPDSTTETTEESNSGSSFENDSRGFSE
jgi:hypothetical protein